MAGYNNNYMYIKIKNILQFSLDILRNPKYIYFHEHIKVHPCTCISMHTWRYLVYILPI